MTSQWWERRRTAFGGAAANYASGRPHYPREALAWAVPTNARAVVDLGAGTGILTRDLLELGLDVVSIEPAAEMRALIPSGAEARAGTAESIPVDDGAVDAVVVGQDWHWFDESKALAEAARVIRPGGSMALMWNLLDTSDPLSRTIADIVEAEERVDSAVMHDAAPPFDDPSRFDTPEQLLIPHVQGYDAVRIVEFALSRSQTILLEAADRDALVERLRAAVPPEPFPVHWVCEAWRATRL
jgi:SAM-dependent methyltransferase